MLVRLIYASRATEALDEQLLRSILETSRAGNLAHGITGVLCTDARAGVFLQVLEGGRPEVNRLYANVVRDTRHRDVCLVSFEEIGARRFTAWQMGSVDLEKVNRSTILRFSERPELDPYTLSASAAEALLEELAERASVGGHANRRTAKVA